MYYRINRIENFFFYFNQNWVVWVLKFGKIFDLSTLTRLLWNSSFFWKSYSSYVMIYQLWSFHDHDVSSNKTWTTTKNLCKDLILRILKLNISWIFWKDRKLPFILYKSLNYPYSTSIFKIIVRTELNILFCKTKCFTNFLHKISNYRPHRSNY